jgi:hypothetical protein
MRLMDLAVLLQLLTRLDDLEHSNAVKSLIRLARDEVARLIKGERTIIAGKTVAPESPGVAAGGALTAPAAADTARIPVPAGTPVI